MQDHLNHGRLRTHPHVTDKKTGQGVGSSWIMGRDVVVVACLGVGGIGLTFRKFFKSCYFEMAFKAIFRR